MKVRILSCISLWLCLGYSSSLDALTTEEFFVICESAGGECSQHPILQAYIGGALDLLATLDDQTDYFDPMYCRQSSELFDVSAIMEFMSLRRDDYKSHNAMLLVIHYFESNGEC